MLRLVFIASIVMALLFFYCYSTYDAIRVLLCLNDSKPDGSIRVLDGTKELLGVVGGLVSTLVISVLAITPVTGSPAKTLISNMQFLSDDETNVSLLTKKVTTVITYLFIGVWFVCGICSVVFAYFTPDIVESVPELTNVAKSWFGMAVGAAYAFFGLKPPADTGKS